MKRFTDLIEEILPEIKEVFPWDMEDILEDNPEVLLIDTREPYEFDKMRIANSINVPRGVLETACDWGYDETVPELAAARDKQVVVICRSGNRSAFAAHVMQQMGYSNVASLKTGLRGWNDYELPLVDAEGNEVDIDDADEFFTSRVKPEQMPPDKR